MPTRGIKALVIDISHEGQEDEREGRGGRCKNGVLVVALKIQDYCLVCGWTCHVKIEKRKNHFS